MKYFLHGITGSWFCNLFRINPSRHCVFSPSLSAFIAVSCSFTVFFTACWDLQPHCLSSSNSQLTLLLTTPANVKCFFTAVHCSFWPGNKTAESFNTPPELIFAVLTLHCSFNFTPPELGYAVNEVYQFIAHPLEDHWQAVKTKNDLVLLGRYSIITP